jgi:hypothetical protein
MREEGDLWNAYYARPGTMDGAIFLGSIRKAFVVQAPRKIVFMHLMQQAVSDIIEETTGTRPSELPEPEHERGGHAPG